MAAKSKGEAMEVVWFGNRKNRGRTPVGEVVGEEEDGEMLLQIENAADEVIIVFAVGTICSFDALTIYCVKIHTRSCMLSANRGQAKSRGTSLVSLCH